MILRKIKFETLRYSVIFTATLYLSISLEINTNILIFVLDIDESGRALDQLGDGNILRQLDTLGGGNILRQLDNLGDGNILRQLDTLGGGNILRQLDQLGNGNILRETRMPVLPYG